MHFVGVNPKNCSVRQLVKEVECFDQTLSRRTKFHFFPISIKVNNLPLIHAVLVNKGKNWQLTQLQPYSLINKLVKFDCASRTVRDQDKARVCVACVCVCVCL